MSWSGGSGCGCISLRLEPTDSSNLSSYGPYSSNPMEDKGRSGNRSPNCTQLVGRTMVLRVNSNACGTASAATSVSISAVPSISACSASPLLAVTSSSSLAFMGNRYKATGFSKEVVDISGRLASRGLPLRGVLLYAGPWKSWCSQRATCPLSAPVAEVLAFPASLGPIRTSDKIVYLDKFSVITNTLHVRMVCGDLAISCRIGKILKAPPTKWAALNWELLFQHVLRLKFRSQCSVWSRSSYVQKGESNRKLITLR